MILSFTLLFRDFDIAFLLQSHRQSLGGRFMFLSVWVDRGTSIQRINAATERAAKFFIAAGGAPGNVATVVFFAPLNVKSCSVKFIEHCETEILNAHRR